MCKDYLIETMEMNCPICNENHIVEKRKRITKGLVKKEVVTYEELYYVCPLTDVEENEFVPAKLFDENLLRARDSYRKHKGLLTSEEIKEIRNRYELSQSDFSLLLGWGEVTVTRYESKKIQDETYDNIMRIAANNPIFTLENLDKHKDKFSLDKYIKIRNNILKIMDQLGNSYFKQLEIKHLYTRYQEESVYNGYKHLDLKKLADVIGYFANFIPNLYKVKLMKLLWYVDVLYFKRYGKSMTGLVYKHMPYGALPLGYNEIIYLPTICVNEEVLNRNNENIIYKIKPKETINISNFTLDELNVLETVASKFKDYNTNQIVKYMHSEKAYTDISEFSIIPYDKAQDLKDFK